MKVYCNNKIPPELRDQIKIGFSLEVNSVTLFEQRPYFKNPEEWTKRLIAQFRFKPETKLWSLYWRRHTGKWLKYDKISSALNLEELITEVEDDPMQIFWG